MTEGVPQPTGPTLAIDCSTSHLAMALVDPVGRVLARSAPDVGRQHAALVTVHLAELFEHAGVRRDTVGRIHVGVGPGSYTGVRVAVAAAKGLGRAWGVEVYGVYSLIAQAGPGLKPGARGVVTRDARRGNVYAQTCARATTDDRDGAPSIVALDAPLKVPEDALADRFALWQVLPAGPPDAAVLAATSNTVAAEPLYL